MVNNNYTLSTNDSISDDSIVSIKNRNKILHDFDNEHVLTLKSLVASGDYLAVLATNLDEISQNLAKNNPEMHIQIEHLIADLLYLHEKYTVTKR